MGRCRHLPHRWSTWRGSAPRAGSACRSSALALEGESSPELDGQALADHGLGRGGLRALEGGVNALLAWPECCRACSIGQMLGRPPRSPCRGVVSHNFLLRPFPPAFLVVAPILQHAPRGWQRPHDVLRRKMCPLIHHSEVLRWRIVAVLQARFGFQVWGSLQLVAVQTLQMISTLPLEHCRLHQEVAVLEREWTLRP